MNISVINLKTVLIKFIKIIIIIAISMIIINLFTKYILTKRITIMLPRHNYNSLLEAMLLSNKETANRSVGEYILSTQLISEVKIDSTEAMIENNLNVQNIIEEIPEIEITKNVQIEVVQENNIEEKYNFEISSVKLKNESDYEITDEILATEVNLEDKQNILIYHTHTSESYTPTEQYNYAMTGNYRTTDNNYNVVRVGKELEKSLIDKNFKVIHSDVCHDYPSYSGSYAKALETAQNLLYGQTTQIVFDIHRDAIGDGTFYGPTVKVDNNSVAQLMFVIGTDGGGLEHPNWIQNLKIAIEIQNKANELYPGLFRPIIIRNSRYNQHVTTGASIIEVGATGNTLEECLLSMQYLANVISEYLK